MQSNCSVEHWQKSITNDFEDVVFPLYPALKMIKEKLYATGALYASLSGSGSTVYGIFEREPIIKMLIFPVTLYISFDSKKKAAS
jgi:4-diphosphocytidyl-2-C-methyl-D-erythritol kinase